MIYDVTTLSIAVGKGPAALERIGKTVENERGMRLYACWTCEIGAVGAVLLLRGYPSADAVQEDRERMVRDEVTIADGEPGERSRHRARTVSDGCCRGVSDLSRPSTRAARSPCRSAR